MLHQRFAIKRFPVLLGNVRNPLFADALRFGGGNQYLAQFVFDNTEEDRKNRQHFELLYPPQQHPVVRVHPVSGRKVLFVNPQFTIAIKDMDEREGRSLLDTLFHQALIPEYQFRLHWAPHTIAMWDNRSTQHYAVNDYYPQRRFMERVTIRGGPVIGVKRADPDGVRKAKSLVPANVERYGGHRPHRQVQSKQSAADG
jgi:hypothetical protein